MWVRLPPSRTVCFVVCAILVATPRADAQSAHPPAATTDLDEFMRKVLARREVNRQTLEKYVVDEEEEFEILGPGRARIHRSERTFTWYVRDGMHVRSPVRFNGVVVGHTDREKYEEAWIRRERQRQERRAKREQEKRSGKAVPDEPKEVVVAPDSVEVGVTGVPTEPRFVSEAYFMDFKFDEGNYYLAGREQLEGKDVLRIEYYPQRMFSDDDDEADPEREQRREARRKHVENPQRQVDREKAMERDLERKMNKTALVTLWVDPANHQIVKYTFENVWLDFFPAAWLVRIDDIRASMTMGQPFPGVWLPRAMNIHGAATLAVGSFEASYARNFSEYRQADVTSRITVPKRDDDAAHVVTRPPLELREPVVVEHEDFLDERAAQRPRGPFVVENDQPHETIAEIRVHGNAFISDNDVLAIAGVKLGDVLASGGLEDIERRLRASGKFETVEVRKRYRSLAMTDVAIVLVVHEHPSVRPTSAPDGTPRIVRMNPLRRIGSALMFFPILSYADGYGFTYGARFSTVGLIGMQERLSVPLTWGGTRRAALEFERTFRRGPVTRVLSSIGIWQRENPRFEIDDRRFELHGRVERAFLDSLRVGLDASRSTVKFGVLDDDLGTLGADVELDTRGDPAFPRNAVLLRAGWTGLYVSPGAAATSLPRIDRYTTDARGYVRLVGQTVLAGRALYTAADATLPPYERLLLGGSSTLRGLRTGSFDGDRMFVTSAEIRVPLTSVISGAKLGFNTFFDAGKVWNVEGRMADAEWQQGAGAGVFLLASVLRLNLSVARGLKSGDTRLHLSSGFSF